MIAHSKNFRDMTIYLDGATFENCKFERCIFVYSGALPLSLKGNTLIDCEWQFTGAAELALQFLTALHAQGGDARQLVENTIACIRGAHLQ